MFTLIANNKSLKSVNFQSVNYQIHQSGLLKKTYYRSATRFSIKVKIKYKYLNI